MTDEADIDMLAAEYVLGTLPADERASVALRSRYDQRLADAIEGWERRLSPLTEAITPGEVPARLWPLIEARIAALADKAEGAAQVAVLQRRLDRWRTAALAASALAAALVLVVGVREIFRPEPDKAFVAVLQKDAQSPAFLVSVDLEKQLLTIRAVSAPPQPGKSYELWLVHDQLKTPKSLGVISDQPFTVVQPHLASYSPKMIEQSTLAVSLEPAGGSPSGTPTGPVLFAGKLIQATE